MNSEELYNLIEQNKYIKNNSKDTEETSEVEVRRLKDIQTGFYNHIKCVEHARLSQNSDSLTLNP